MYVCIFIYVCNALGMQLCPTVCSCLLLPSKMAVAHKRLYSSYPLQRKASKECSRKGTAASYHISVITMTPALATYKQKLFYHIQAKGGAMFGNFILFAQPLPYPPPLDLQALNSSLSVRILCASEWTAQDLVVLQLGSAGGHTRLQSFCFSC